MSDLVSTTRSWIKEIRREAKDEKTKVDRHDVLDIAIPENLVIGVTDDG